MNYCKTLRCTRCKIKFCVICLRAQESESETSPICTKENCTFKNSIDDLPKIQFLIWFDI